MFRFALGVGLAVACLVGWGIGVFAPMTPLSGYWPMLPTLLLVTALVYSLLNSPSIYRQLQDEITEAERLKTQAHNYKKERLPAAQKDAVSVDAEAERQYRWHRFWSDCLEYAAGNGFHYRNNFDKILRYEGWYGGFAMPLVRAGWLRPIAQAIRTEPMEGWTATRMLRELAAGTPPPYPEGEPPQWKQTDAKNTTKHGENKSSVFATDK